MKVDEEFYTAVKRIQGELKRLGYDIPATDITAVLGRWLSTRPPQIIVLVAPTKKKRKRPVEDILPFFGQG